MLVLITYVYLNVRFKKRKMLQRVDSGPSFKVSKFSPLLTMKADKGNRGVNPHFRNLVTRWKLAISSKPRPPFPGRTPVTLGLETDWASESVRTF